MNKITASFPIHRAVAAVQWMEEDDHPSVRRTNYMEVAQLLGTSGCSKEEPYWIHNVMGILDLPNGKVTVCPGDWILTDAYGGLSVISDEQYTQLYYHPSQDYLSDRIRTCIKFSPNNRIVGHALTFGMEIAQLFERRVRLEALKPGPQLLQHLLPYSVVKPSEAESVAAALLHLFDYQLVGAEGGYLVTNNRPVGDVLYDQEDAYTAADILNSSLSGRDVSSPVTPRNGEYTENYVARRILNERGQHIVIFSSQHQALRIREHAQSNGIAFREIETKGLSRADIKEQVDAIPAFFKLYPNGVIAIDRHALLDFRVNDLTVCAQYTLHSTWPLTRKQYLSIMSQIKPAAIPENPDDIPVRALDLLYESPNTVNNGHVKQEPGA